MKPIKPLKPDAPKPVSNPISLAYVLVSNTNRGIRLSA
jgi:hypothetical protein